MSRSYGRPSKAPARAGPPRRLISEAPLEEQIRYESPSNPDHQQQMRALHGLHPDLPWDFEEDEDLQEPVNQRISDRSSQRFNPRMVDDAIRKHNDIQVTKPVPNIGDILAGFQPPEKPIARTVKLELDEQDILAHAALRTPTPGAEKRKHPRDVDERPTAAAIEQQEPTEAIISNGTRNQQRKTPGRATQSMFVDLTDEDEFADAGSHQTARPPHRASEAVRSAVRLPPPPEVSARPPPPMPPTPAIHASNTTTTPTLTLTQMEAIDHVEIPQNLLQQARGFFRQARVGLPANITTWSDLKVFAVQHPLPALAPAIIRGAQAHAFYAANIPPAPPLPPATAPRPNAQDSLPPPQRPAPPARNSRPDDSRAVAPATVRVKVEEPESSQDSRSQVSADTRVNGVTNTSTIGAQPPLAPTLIDPTSTNSRPDQPANTDTGPTDLQILRLTEPLGLCPELLPPDSPEGHPHLVPVWDPALISLPQEKHDHLDLIHTVVSIIYRYESKTRAAIKAFLDTEKVRHFFFLLKSRSDRYHSWSIEREGEIITIGIDRNQRAPNVSESERPSAGQYDLTIRYQLQPSTTTSSTSDSDTETDSPSLPARWTPIGTSIFPAQPPIATFLYNTPPNRGADDHEMYEHPPPRTSSSLRNYFRTAHTDAIPPDRLSILARYFQTTAFTTKAMDAEFQVCWGHRVRYDAVLGRVRATFRNAIKGAVTQAKKREAGEYNRPVNGLPTPTATAKKGGERPGTGVTVGHLRGEEATDVKRKVIGAKQKRTAGEMEMAGFIVEDDEAEVAERVGNRDGESDGVDGIGAVRKRMKREREGNPEASGSEYSTSDESD